MTDQDPVADVLRAVPTSDRVRAAAWDAYYESTDANDFEARLKALPLPDEVKASLWDAKQASAPKMNTATVNGADVPVEDGGVLQSAGTFAKHVGQQINPLTAIGAIAQASPLPKAIGGGGVPIPQALGGSGMESGLVKTVQGIGSAQGALLDKAKASYEAGDTLTAARHFVNYLLPMIGPGIDKASDEMASGELAAGAGDAVGLGLGLFGPQKLPGLARQAVERLNPAEKASNAFAAERGIPLDAATATGSNTLRAMEKRTANSMGGEGTAERLIQRQEQALDRVGGELADQVHPSVVTADQAGQGVRDALQTGAKGKTARANAAYDTLRAAEQDPVNQLDMPLPKQAVDLLPAPERAGLRTIVHEMEREPFSKRLLQQGKVGSSLEHVPGTGGAGAAVYDDVLANLEGGYRPTRDVVQTQIEEYLGGGKETAIVKAARAVAKERAGQQQFASRLNQDPLTRLEKTRVTSEPMGLPTDLREAKAALQPVRDELVRQMPITQQQANPGLKAIQNILDGPDWAPMSQVDRDLSAIKSLARSRGGLAKLAVRHLEDAVQKAAANGGQEISGTLAKGRKAIVERVAIEKTEKGLGGGALQEPVAAFKRLTAPKDSGLRLLQRAQAQTPAEVPKVARAWLEERLTHARSKGGFSGQDKLWAEWRNLGPQTKAILFPGAGQVKALDEFFLLAKRIMENPQPSGTAHNLTVFNVLSQPATYALSKLLYTPGGVRAVNRLMRLSSGRVPVSEAARATALADVAAEAKAIGADLALPKAADADPTDTPK